MYNQEKKRISGYKDGITISQFITDGKTSHPLENLVGRIVEQGILPDEEIEHNILFNSNVCCREKEVSGVTYKATLLAGELEYNKLCRNNGDHRKFYNAGTIVIQRHTYHFTGGMQPKEYTLKNIWDSLEPYLIGESTSPNVILFGIIRHYYKGILEDLQLYIKDNPSDIDKKKYYDFIKNEWESFLENYKEIKPAEIAGSKDKKVAASQKADANKEANLNVRKLIGELQLLWNNIGDTITLADGSTILVEGVQKTMNKEVYDEYKKAMDTLGIRQMILQGPPGTSKTYSAKAFLRHTANNCSATELADMQITDYFSEEKYCGKLFKEKVEPVLAWDIIQFHPSYGYEDFIRGIKVSTKENSNTIIYKTVNKVLGNIAELAHKHRNTQFYLLIDEINRANLATVFGELIYGLEYRTESVATPYAVEDDNRISLPENLYIIGTMNTADKSIGGIDYAIRRRFLFFEQLPDRNVISNFNKASGHNQEDVNEKACRLFDKICDMFTENYLSPEYRKEDVQLGHTYFLVDSVDKLRMRFEYQIIPILKEYYKDGIISFIVEDSDVGFEGLLNCITGKINIASEKEKVDKIFDSLIA